MWYSKIASIFKFADAESKIKSYKVEDKVLQFFIRAYENKIAWNGYQIEQYDEDGNLKVDNEGNPVKLDVAIKDASDIKEYIHKILLPDLYTRFDVDADRNVYVKKIDMRKWRQRFQPGQNPEFDAAYRTFETDEKRGVEEYLEHVNKRKMETFGPYEAYFTVNKEFTAENSPFVYMFLNKMIESSSDKTLNPPPTWDILAMNEVYQEFRNSEPNFKSTKDYDEKEKELANWVQSNDAENKESLEQVCARINMTVDDARAFVRDEGLYISQKNRDAILLWNKPSPNQIRESINKLAEKLNTTVENVNKYLAHEQCRTGNFTQIYQRMLTKLNAEKTSVIDTKEFGKWIKFPQLSTVKDIIKEDGTIISKDTIIQQNYDTLDAFSQPRRWCTTKNFMAPSYLSDGDFYVWVRNNQAECAIRFLGNRIIEFAGDQTRGVHTCPTANYKEIIEFVQTRKLENSIVDHNIGTGFWKQLQETAVFNSDFFDENGNVKSEEIENIKEIIKKNPRVFAKIDVTKFDAHQDVLNDMKSVCTESWYADLVSKERGGEAVLNWGKDLPTFVQEDSRFAETFHQKLASVYKDYPASLDRVMTIYPLHWRFYPAGKQIFIDDVINVYKIGYQFADTVHNLRSRSVEEKNSLQSRKSYFDRIKANINSYCPEILQDIDFKRRRDEAEVDGIEWCLSQNVFSDSMDPQHVNAFFNDCQKAYDSYLMIKYIDYFKGVIAHASDIKSVMKKDAFEQELKKWVPKKFRSLSNYSGFLNSIIFRVYKENIVHYKHFDSKIKEENESLYADYKEYIMQQNVTLLRMTYGDDYFDEELLQDPDFRALLAQRDPSDISKIIKRINNLPSAYIELYKSDPQTAERADVIDAYVKARVRTKIMNTKRDIMRDFPLLPNVVKSIEEVKKAYQDVVEDKLRTAPVGNPYYVNCDTLDPVAFEDARIANLCQQRASAQTRRANSSWYKVAQKNMWDYLKVMEQNDEI